MSWVEAPMNGLGCDRVSVTSYRAQSHMPFVVVDKKLPSPPIIRIKDAIGMRQSFNFFVCGE
jgi:hypothetical protein